MIKTYGTIDYKAGAWVIEAEPHVVLRLKRVFASVSAGQHGKICITDTVDTSRDVDWFLERYPLSFESSYARDRLASQAALHRERTEVLAQLLAAGRNPRHFDLAIPARPYQAVAAEMLLSTGGLLVADEMGLGKTAIAIAAQTDPRMRPALVVTLTALPRQWSDEIQRFAPGMKTHIIERTNPYDITRPGFKASDHIGLKKDLPDVILCNYHKLAGWAGHLSRVCSSVTYDEIQELRHGETTDKGKSAMHISRNVSYRLGLSGTPIYNYGGEIFHVMEAVKPGALGTHPEFKQEWCGSCGEDDKPRLKDPAAFGAFLRSSGLMIRRTTKEVGLHVPKVSRVPHRIDCDMDRLEQIESAAGELARIILAQGEGARGEQFQTADVQLSTLVRQATGIAKAPFVADFVRLAIESGEKVLLFGWHREVYSIWLEALKEYEPLMFTGSESTKQKERAKRAFVDGSAPLLIMSLRAGAGIDGLQKACRVAVFGELDYSPGVHEQNIFRLARAGQLHPVIAYFLLSDSGSDPVIADILGIKRSQVEGLRGGDDSGVFEVSDHQAKSYIRRLAEQYLHKKRARA